MFKLLAESILVSLTLSTCSITEKKCGNKKVESRLTWITKPWGGRDNCCQCIYLSKELKCIFIVININVNRFQLNPIARYPYYISGW